VQDAAAGRPDQAGADTKVDVPGIARGRAWHCVSAAGRLRSRTNDRCPAAPSRPTPSGAPPACRGRTRPPKSRRARAYRSAGVGRGRGRRGRGPAAAFPNGAHSTSTSRCGAPTL
jgi:hypothetical protein